MTAPDDEDQTADTGAETPKDKRAAALKRIRELASERSTANRPGAEPSGPAGGKGPKRAPKHGTVGHRPQGG